MNTEGKPRLRFYIFENILHIRTHLHFVNLYRVVSQKKVNLEMLIAGIFGLSIFLGPPVSLSILFGPSNRTPAHPL